MTVIADGTPADLGPPTVPDPGRPDAAPGRRRPALSPSRAGDFKQCPLLYRFRVVDRLPETPTPAQLRGTVVHAVLERLFALPAAERVPERAGLLADEVLADLAADDRARLAGEAVDEADGSGPDPASDPASEPDLTTVRARVGRLLESYFAMEDPRRLEPAACELLLEGELPSGVAVRGYVDRLDVAPTGEIRIVDYKTGAAPRALFEARALFQMKFYALVLLRTRGVLPRQLRLMYLADGEFLTYAPDADELGRFERTLDALWAAVLRAAATGDFRPRPSRLCSWCSHQAVCPSFGGTPPAYPGWPAPEADAEAPRPRSPDAEAGAHPAAASTGAGR
jgi:putative RecB family exonuclease